jgi:hypothetical protein
MDLDTKSVCTIIAMTHKDAVKEILQLLTAMYEVADNMLSKICDHDTANQMIDSWHAALCAEIFLNAAEKNAVLQSHADIQDGPRSLREP